MNKLEELLTILKVKRCENNNIERFYIPEIWNTLNFSEYKTDPNRKNEIDINPYDYYIYYIANILNISLNSNENVISDITAEKSMIYSAQLRMLTAWNHTSEDIEFGSFVKSITLLPYLKEMNINIIYLLPIFRTGHAYHKGNVGSPYAIKDIYKIDNTLHDNLLGECNDYLLELQFNAFVEACHILGIKVIVDFVFRTVSRDSELIVKHPEWFYWIKTEDSKDFKPLYIENLGELTYVNDSTVDNIYLSKGLNKYLERFTYPPNIKESDKWNDIISEYKSNCEDNILFKIENVLQVTTAPAFSDVINDFQEPWEDVTYLKLSFDVHEKAKEYITENQAPYILQDIAKSNLFLGKEINCELWEYIENVIPYYQEHFGIDGARIDMGHALPYELNNRIIKMARNINPKFILWSEDFFIEDSEASREKGFNFITGKLWNMYREYNKKNFWINLTRNILLESQIPIISTLETADTLRIPSLYSGLDELSFLLTISYFAPNTIPMINNGMEIGEKQPMNIGLDNIKNTKNILCKDDPMNGLLSFFDKYRLHWYGSENLFVRKLIITLSIIRGNVINIVSCKDNFTDISSVKNINSLIIWKYSHNGKNMFIISNTGDSESINIDTEDILRIELEDNQIFYKDYILFYIDENAAIKYINSNTIICIPKFKTIFAIAKNTIQANELKKILFKGEI